MQSATFIDVVCDVAERKPDHTAFVYLVDGEQEERSISFSEVDRQGRAIATSLQQCGEVGDRVLLLYASGLDFLTGFLGCLYSKRIAVPITPLDPNHIIQSLFRIGTVLEDAECTIGLTTSAILSTISPFIEAIPQLQMMIWMSTEKVDHRRADDWQRPLLGPDDLAYLQYSAGTTGIPKGVMISHGNLIHNIRALSHGFGTNQESVFISWLPMFHDMGLVGKPLHSLFLGVPIYFMSPEHFISKPRRWLQAITRYGGTVSGSPNFGYELCLRKIKPEEREGLDLSSLITAWNGAESVQQKTLERFSKAFAPYGFRRSSFVSCYGLAEATLMVSGGPHLDPPVYLNVQTTDLRRNIVAIAAEAGPGTQALVGNGNPSLGLEVVVVDLETMLPCPANRVGEIWVRSQSVALGYWNNPELTKRMCQALISGEGPYLRTGDLGFLLEGELFVMGRIKDLLTIEDRFFYPHEIELIAEKSHSGIRPGCGAAITIPVAGTEQLALVCEIDRRFHQRRQEKKKVSTDQRVAERRKIDLDLGEGELQRREFKPDDAAAAIWAAVKDLLGLDVCAIKFLRAGMIPKTSSGKVRRHLCREHFFDGTLDALSEWWDSEHFNSAPPKLP